MAVTADDAREARFARAALGTRGYHEPQVDAFVARVVATLDGTDGLTAREVHDVSFRKAPMTRRGYDEASVDAFLRQVESTLAADRHASANAESVYIAPSLEHTHTRRPFWQRVLTRR